MSGQNAEHISPWKYENQMSFLRAHFNNKRLQISNVPSVTKNTMEEENTGEGTSGDGTSYAEKESSLIESTMELESSSVHEKDQLSCQELATPSTGNITQIRTPLAKKTKTSHETGSSAHEILKTYFENKKSKQDHLTSYFKGVEDTVRTFSPLLQIEIKSRISALVSEYELKNFTAGSMPSHCYPSTSERAMPSPYYTSTSMPSHCYPSTSERSTPSPYYTPISMPSSDNPSNPSCFTPIPNEPNMTDLLEL